MTGQALAVMPRLRLLVWFDLETALWSALALVVALVLAQWMQGACRSGARDCGWRPCSCPWPSS